MRDSVDEWQHYIYISSTQYYYKQIMLNNGWNMFNSPVAISQILWPIFAMNTERNWRSDVFGLKCSDYKAIILL